MKLKFEEELIRWSVLICFSILVCWGMSSTILAEHFVPKNLHPNDLTKNIESVSKQLLIPDRRTDEDGTTSPISDCRAGEEGWGPDGYFVCSFFQV